MPLTAFVASPNITTLRLHGPATSPGSIPSIIFTVLISLASVIFIGSSASRGPKGVYTVPDATGIR
jgi:hypothetical protein